MTVMDIIAEGLDIHGLCKSKEERTQRVYELLRTVGLNEQHAIDIHMNSLEVKDNVLVLHVH